MQESSSRRISETWNSQGKRKRETREKAQLRFSWIEATGKKIDAVASGTSRRN